MHVRASVACLQLGVVMTKRGVARPPALHHEGASGSMFDYEFVMKCIVNGTLLGMIYAVTLGRK